MVDYVLQDDNVQKIFFQLASGNAWDKSILDNATNVKNMIGNLTDMTALVGGMTNNSSIAELANFMNTTVSRIDTLVDHLNNQYDNLPDRLSIATSNIADSLGFETLGTIEGMALGAPGGNLKNPGYSMFSMFGTLLGKSDDALVKAMPSLINLSAYDACIVGACIVNCLNAMLTIGEPSIQSPLGNGDINSIMNDPTNKLNMSKMGNGLVLIGGHGSSSELGNTLGSLVPKIDLISSLGAGLVLLSSLDLTNISSLVQLNAAITLIHNSILGLAAKLTLLAQYYVSDFSSLSGGIDAISANIDSSTSDISTLVSNEQTAFFQAQQNLSMMADAQVIPSLYDNECSRMVLRSVGSTGLVDILEGNTIISTETIPASVSVNSGLETTIPESNNSSMLGDMFASHPQPNVETSPKEKQ